MSNKHWQFMDNSVHFQSTSYSAAWPPAGVNILSLRSHRQVRLDQCILWDQKSADPTRGMRQIYELGCSVDQKPWIWKNCQRSRLTEQLCIQQTFQVRDHQEQTEVHKTVSTKCQQKVQEGRVEGGKQWSEGSVRPQKPAFTFITFLGSVIWVEWISGLSLPNVSFKSCFCSLSPPLYTLHTNCLGGWHKSSQPQYQHNTMKLESKSTCRVTHKPQSML